MYGTMQQHLQEKLAEIQKAGLYKRERVIAGPQQPEVSVADGVVLNLCANNYLGLANHPAVVEAAPGKLRILQKRLQGVGTPAMIEEAVAWRLPLRTL